MGIGFRSGVKTDVGSIDDVSSNRSFGTAYQASDKPTRVNVVGVLDGNGPYSRAYVELLNPDTFQTYDYHWIQSSNTDIKQFTRLNVSAIIPSNTKYQANTDGNMNIEVWNEQEFTQ